MKHPMSLPLVYRDLMQIPSAYAWNALLTLMREQIERGELTSKHLTYYAMRIQRRYAEEQQMQRAKKAAKREPMGSCSIGSLLDTALSVQG